MVLAASGCRTTTGKVLGPIAIASAVAGNALVWTSERPSANELDARSGTGIALITVSTIAMAVWAAVETMHDEQHRGGAGWSDASGGDGDHSAGVVDAAAAPELYDRAGAYAGRGDAQGNYYDRSGAYAGRVDAQNNIYDRSGAYAGRVDAQGNIYDGSGAHAGRIHGTCDAACKRDATGLLLLKP
jgi:hypothetical protein